MVAIKRMPGRHRHPAIAQFFVSIASESTSICADHGDTEELELKDPLEGEVQISPSRVVVSGSVLSIARLDLEATIRLPEPLLIEDRY